MSPVNPMRLFGIETEYGIVRERHPDMDVVLESMALVRAYRDGPLTATWNYRRESPHQDVRGFRVAELQQDREEQQFAEQDRDRSFSFHEMKSDLVLPNGARFYNDHTHPEYSTPECRTLRDILAHDRAGECIVQAAADRRNQELGDDSIQIYKNNTDFHGHSYGCHDNYLLPRAVPFEKLAEGLIPFLVSRQLLAGSGKVGLEGQDQTYQPGHYQISQRADFMETELSVDTMHNRPILNTRDEPHADRSKYQRLHLIVGDANMCGYATALKVGTTQLVLDLIQHDAAPRIRLADSVSAIRTLSRDPDLRATVPLANGGAMSGLDLQFAYLSAAQRRFDGMDEETKWLLREWATVLDLLQRDRLALVGRIDWVTKHWMLETFAKSEQVEWTDPWLASLDLEYHNLNPERGLFRSLEAEGKIPVLCEDEHLASAMRAGPQDTRGGLRGLCVQKFSPYISTVQWEHIQFRNGDDPFHLDMSDMVDPQTVRAMRNTLETSTCLADLRQSLSFT